MTVAERIARFIQDQGHRVEVTHANGAEELSELVFRARGQVFSVSVSELEPQRLSISTAYEIPNWVQNRSQALDALGEAEGAFPEARFMLAQEDTIFVATVEYQASEVDAFVQHFWTLVGRLREAGTAAVERMVDRSESKAAADKFIRQFMKGER
ncbi:MAG: hypothetical protein JO092_08675 [Candidatus Eremiobacteraeota bacterium]|nr:hypothetical protein [Candidatus Eremiobacteraeota bacterium]